MDISFNNIGPEYDKNDVKISTDAPDDACCTLRVGSEHVHLRLKELVDMTEVLLIIATKNT